MADWMTVCSRSSSVSARPYSRCRSARCRRLFSAMMTAPSTISPKSKAPRLIRFALILPCSMPVAVTSMVTGMTQAVTRAARRLPSNTSSTTMTSSAHLMSLGALDFGLIVDGAVIIAENSLRHLAERQHELRRKLSLDERLETIIVSAKEMIRPTIYGQAIIILVYVPLLTFTGVEGKTFIPMAMTVIIALAAAFVLSITFVPAMVAIAITGRVQERE